MDSPIKVDELVSALSNCNTHKDMQRVLQERGFTGYGSGAFKGVWLDPERLFVVKLHSFRNTGALEARNYDTAPDYIKPFLVRLIAQGNGYQIQPFVPQSYKHCGATCNKCRHAMMDFAGNHDHSRDGLPIIFDYGQSEQWVA